MSGAWRILLVEDDEDDYVLVRDMFATSRQPVDLHWVRSADAALGRILAERFDAVLCDYLLGARSGIDLVRDVAAAGSTVPVVVLTGQGSRDVDLAAMAAGAADYLVKDELGPSVLERTVRYASERRRGEEALRRRDAILAAVARVASQLLSAGDWRDEMPGVLAVLGESARVSRAYVFENTRVAPGVWTTSHRWEWTAPGVEAKDAGTLQRLSFQARWATELAAGRPLHGPADEMPPNERAVLARYGIRSIAVVPVLAGGSFWGFLAVDDCAAPRQWSDSELDALRAAADAIASAIARDEAESKLRERDEQLRQSQKMEAVGRLAGGIAHDFNNLLTAISGYGELLMRGLGEDDPRRNDCAEVLRAAERAAALTRQLLLFGRREKLQARPVDVNHVVRDTERLLRRVIGERIAVELELAADLPRAVVDPGHLEQVLMNLAINARDAMPAGGQLTIGTSWTRGDEDAGLAGPPAGARVEISLADTGIGMSPEVRERIFEPFFTTKARGKGTGLGLPMVYSIVEQSGGSIHVDSVPGEGSRFTVSLPAAASAVGETPALAAPSLAAPAPGHRAAVLVVDDEEHVLRLTQRVLQPLGFEVRTAPDPAAAETVFAAQGADLLLTDLGLAGIGGVTLAERLRARDPGLRVVFMSGHSESTLHDEGALPAGAAFLEKPFTAAALTARVEAALAPGGGVARVPAGGPTG